MAHDTAIDIKRMLNKMIIELKNFYNIAIDHANVYINFRLMCLLRLTSLHRLKRLTTSPRSTIRRKYPPVFLFLCFIVAFLKKT